MAVSPTQSSFHLSRLSAFPILPEGHLVYKVADVLSLPTKERLGSPLIGHFAPEIVLKDQLDRDCSLHATIALGRPIVLYFFPLAGSPHCTVQGCTFRDALMNSTTFTEQDAIVIGVSQDPPHLLKKFVNKHDLNFIVLSDENREAFNAFGINTRFFGLLNNRCTFVIDPSGVIRGMCEGVLAARGHIEFAEKWLRRIEDEIWRRQNGYQDSAMAASLSEGASPRTLDRLQEKKWGGVDKAPRHGKSNSIPAKEKGMLSGGGGSSDRHHYDHGHKDRFINRSHLGDQPQQRHSSDSPTRASPVKPTGPGARLSLRRGFFRRNGAPAPLPPTYENFDSGVQDFGEVENLPSGDKERDHDAPCNGSGDGPVPHGPPGDKPFYVRQSHIDSKPSSFAQSCSDNHGLHSRNGSAGSQCIDGAARKHAGSNDEDEGSAEDKTFLPIPLSKSANGEKEATASTPKSAVSRFPEAMKGGVAPPLSSSSSRTLSQQSQGAAPPPTLTEVAEDRESETAVRSIVNGAIEISPRMGPVPLPLSSPSQPSPSSGVTFTMAGPIPQPPRRTTSRIHHPPLSLQSSRPSSKGSSTDTSADTVRSSPNYTVTASSTYLVSKAPGDGHGLGYPLAPRPPTIRPAPARCQPQEFTKSHVISSKDVEEEDEEAQGEEESPGEEGLEDDVQVQAAQRLTKQTQPVSPYKSGDLAAVRRSLSLSRRGLGGSGSDLPTRAAPTSPSSVVDSTGGASSQSPMMRRDSRSDVGSRNVANDIQQADATEQRQERRQARGSERMSFSSLRTSNGAAKVNRRPSSASAASAASAASISSSVSRDSVGTFGNGS